nr:hypothetical protein [uncultured Rhodopila sp.]
MIYLIVEGPNDKALMELVLAPPSLPEHQVVSAGGESSAVSLAASIMMKRRQPVIVVLDADATDPEDVRRQEAEYNYLLQSWSNGTEFDLIFAVPDLVCALFTGPGRSASIPGVQLTPEQIDTLQQDPRSVLDAVLQKPIASPVFHSEEMRAYLASSPIVQRIEGSLNRLSSATETRRIPAAGEAEAVRDGASLQPHA